MISKSNCNNIILFVHEKWRLLADMNANTILSLVETFFIVTVLPLLILVAIATVRVVSWKLRNKGLR